MRFPSLFLENGRAACCSRAVMRNEETSGQNEAFNVHQDLATWNAGRHSYESADLMGMRRHDSSRLEMAMILCEIANQE